MDLKRAFEIIEIDETASFSEVKRSYRDLASVWHPDRHSLNSRLLEKSLKKMQEINEAYDLLSLFYANRDTRNTGSHENEKVIWVKCKKCGVNNRIKNLTGVIFKCGNCQSNLFDDETVNNNEERILCGDASCTGTICNGRCNVCGKTLEEGIKEDERKTKRYQKIYEQNKITEKRNQKRKNIIKYCSITAFLILLCHLIFDESSNTEIKQNSEISQAVQSKENPPQFVQDSKILQFNENDFKNTIPKDELKELQRNLKTIGYGIDRIDGIVGPNTICECNKFSADFSPYFKLYSATELLSCAKIHALVSATYPDWAKITRGNLLKEWIAQQHNDFKKEILLALQSNDPQKIIVVLNFYYFDKESPLQLPMPNNGVFEKSFWEGVAPLKISTRVKEQNHLIKILENETNKEILKAFLRGGHTLEFDVPLGSYIIKYAAGEKWYGEHFLVVSILLCKIYFCHFF